jgi:peptide/nickel transport system permease protein
MAEQTRSASVGTIGSDLGSLLPPQGQLVADTFAAGDSQGRTRQVKRAFELWAPAGFLIFLAAACFLWPLIYHVPNPVDGNLSKALLPPLSHGYLFGTDQLGNDVFSRILYGGRVSLEVGLGTTAIGMVIGGSLGMIAAYAGGLLESIIMRVLEVLLSVPSLVLAIIIATFLGPSELHVIWAISIFSIPAFARLARANTLPLRESTFIVAARLGGSNDSRILLRHICPNVVPQLMTFGLLGVGISIIIEASLSFLGLGVPPPGPSWGNMIAAGEINIRSNPDLVLIPAAFLFATVLALNLVGDAIRARIGD